MQVISSCPDCGSPIYGPLDIDDGDSPDVVYTCECRHIPQTYPLPWTEPYQPWYPRGMEPSPNPWWIPPNVICQDEPVHPESPFRYQPEADWNSPADMHKEML